MRYLSTRGRVRDLSFKDAVMMGLADDGGLLLPESIPTLTPGDLDALAKLAYPELAFQVISLLRHRYPLGRSEGADRTLLRELQPPRGDPGASTPTASTSSNSSTAPPSPSRMSPCSFSATSSSTCCASGART